MLSEERSFQLKLEKSIIYLSLSFESNLGIMPKASIGTFPKQSFKAFTEDRWGII